MARPKVLHCKDCGRHVAQCGQLSQRKFCRDCGLRRQMGAIDDLADHNGEYFQRWREAVARSVGATLPSSSTDDVARAGPES